MLLASLLSAIIVLWTESSTPNGCETATSVMEVDDSSAFFATALALLLVWFDFLAAGRKLVRFFLVDFDPRGINETPGSGIMSFVDDVE